ncbi:FixH [Planctomycetes bacterium MalM25]|nr:FixH [Planctomycetes bacterium MalM25]
MTEAAPLPASRFFWPALVVVLLLGHVVLITGSLLLSSTWIPAATTAPSGYEAALKWDTLQAERAASDRLGWTLTMTPTDQTEVNGDRLVRFNLTDADGVPLNGADLDVTLYHHSRPQQPIEVDRVPNASTPGEYATTLSMNRVGLWRLAAVATRGDERFRVETDQWVAAAKGARP